MTLSTLAVAVGSARADTQSTTFVIGNGNAAVNSHITFWDSQWWQNNVLSGGVPPAAFKGYVDTPSGPPACGTPWSTDPGNSSAPPAAPLPQYIEVIVSSNVTKSGQLISGDTSEVVLVQTDPGYAPDPGHAGTGTIVSVVCSANGGPSGNS
jgi:hypothetical protein